MDEKERTLYCGNLAEKVTEDILYELFLQAGPLENVTIPKDKDGRQRNFGFIKFKHSVSVPYAVALMNGVSLYGRVLRLDQRTGTESERNPYLEKLMQYKNPAMQNSTPNRNYNPRESWRYDSRDSRRYDPRPDMQRMDLRPDMQRMDPRPDMQRMDLRPDMQWLDSRPDMQRMDARPDMQRMDYNAWNNDQGGFQPYPSNGFEQNSVAPVGYPPGRYDHRPQWSRNRR